MPKRKSYGPAKDNPNPRAKKLKGNPTKKGGIHGKWHKPKLK